MHRETPWLVFFYRRGVFLFYGIAITTRRRAITFKSWNILIWAGCFFILNTVYFILSEEPAQRKRFGYEYEEYQYNVPRWIPRIRSWKPKSIPQFPRLDGTEVALLRAAYETGHVLDENYALAVNDSQVVYTVFPDLNAAMAYIKSAIENDIEYTIFDKDNKLFRHIKPPKLEQ